MTVRGGCSDSIRPRARTRGALLLALPALALARVESVEAQSPVDELVSACAVVPEDSRTRNCEDAALTVQALTAGLGLLNGGGMDLPGGGSTLGWRLPGSPRMAVFTRFKGLPLEHPVPTGNPQLPSDDDRVYLWGWEFGGAVGAFNGFSLAPTLGGILALDLLGSLQWQLLPETPGFSGDAWSWSLGARLGLLRESFSLPGITASYRYSRVDPGRFTLRATPWEGPDPSPGVSTDLKVSAQSFRAVVAKDLLAVGILAGFGWDWYGSEGDLGPVGDPVSFQDFSADRMLFFGQANVTYLILQLSLEAGWASGMDDLSGGYSGSLDPTSGTPFGGISARVLF